MKLKTIVEENQTLGGKIFDLVSQSLILISLLSFSIETIPTLPESISETLSVLEFIIVILFTIEYFLRFIVADHKIRYVFSFYAVIDLAAILPFYIGCGIDLRSIRVIRLFRLFRVFKLLRYNNAILHFQKALNDIKEELTIFFIATGILLYISSVGIYYCEHSSQPESFSSIFHCLWWAIVTLTTIGYGDMFPVTIGGKIFTSIISLIGIGVVAVPTGLIASSLTKFVNTKTEE